MLSTACIICVISISRHHDCAGIVLFHVIGPLTCPRSVLQVGKRATLWINDLLMDLKNLQRVREEIR